MYKATAAGLRRATRVHTIAPGKVYIGEDQLPQFDNMSLLELVEERARLLGESARCENEILAAKRAGSTRLTGGLGHRKSSICERLGAVNDRIKLLRRINADGCWRQAVEELCPDMAEAIDTRQRELFDAEAAHRS